QLSSFPLTVNGKIDRKALPEATIIQEDNYVAPINETEKKLIEIWAKILDVKEKQISVERDFFELGVNSINAFQTLIQIKKQFSKTIEVGHIFSHRTIRTLANFLDTLETTSEEKIPKVSDEGLVVTSSAQERMFYYYLMDKESLVYNIAGGIMIDGHLDQKTLKSSIESVINRHPSLRTGFVYNEEGVFQKVFEKGHINFEIFNSGSVNLDDAFKNFVRPHNLESGEPVSFGLYKISETKNILFIDVHHIAADGYSLKILMNDLKKLLKGEVLKKLSTNYLDYASWQRQKDIQKQQAYWANQLDGNLPQLELSYVGDTEETELANAQLEQLVIEGEAFEKINQLIKEKGITNFMFLISIYYLLLHKITGNNDIIIGSDVLGRTNTATREIVGTFVNILPLRFKINPEQSFSDFLNAVKKLVLDAFHNQDFQFDEMVKMVGINSNASKKPPIAQVHFAFDDFNYNEQAFNAGDLSFTPVELNRRGTTQYEFKLDASKNNNSFNIGFVYSENLYEKETIKVFLNYYFNIINYVLRNDQLPIRDIDVNYSAEIITY
ncbi:condensation domain-containing protein, partial [Ascidiimonas sp. W6]|uniref:condensation domain-containing protein n=1 Tax=Ascidiimonas meishanensis TaxID=3128903 RepID=UPI0030EEAF19